MNDAVEMASKVKNAQMKLAKLSSEEKTKMLLNMAKKLDENKKAILQENKKDVEKYNDSLDSYMLDRLLLDEKRISFECSQRLATAFSASPFSKCSSTSMVTIKS